MINGSCTNKSCSNKLEKTPVTKTRAARAKAPVVKKEPKITKVPRASKCITYSIKDLPPKEE